MAKKTFTIGLAIALTVTIITPCFRTGGCAEEDATAMPPGRLGLIWNKTWGGNDLDAGHGVAVDDSGIYIAGDTVSYATGGTNNSDILILKYDFDGNEIWNRTWGGGKVDRIFSIVVDNQNIYAAGATWSYGAGERDAFLLKYDLDGNELWSKTWGGTYREIAWSIAVHESYVYITGLTFSYGAGQADLFLLKTDLEGGGSTIFEFKDASVFIFAIPITFFIYCNLKQTKLSAGYHKQQARRRGDGST